MSYLINSYRYQELSKVSKLQNFKVSKFQGFQISNFQSSKFPKLKMYKKRNTQFIKVSFVEILRFPNIIFVENDLGCVLYVFNNSAEIKGAKVMTFAKIPTFQKIQMISRRKY